MKHPLLQTVALYAAGILAGYYCRLSPWPLLAGALSLMLFAVIVRPARTVVLYPLVFLVGWTNFALKTAALSPNDLRHILGEEPALAQVRGRLVETPELRVFEHDEHPSWRTVARIEVSAIQINKDPWRPASGRMAISTRGTLTNLFGGQTVEVSGVAMRPKGPIAEGTFDYRYFLRQQGIYYTLQGAKEEDWRIVASPSQRPLADRFRAWAKMALAKGLPVEDESLRLEWALTLGWKTALTEEVSEPFVRAATYHIFAVDGLRMAILFGIFFCVLRTLRVPRPVSGALLIPILWFYVVLTGCPASAIRATVMLTIIILSWVLRRPSNTLNSLFAAALIILLFEPRQLFQAGFQLSFVVVLFLILTVQPLLKLFHGVIAPDPMLPAQLQRKWPAVVVVPAHFLRDMFLTSLGAWLASLPLVALYFNIFTPASTPANILAVPLCILVLVSNLLSLLLAGWFPAAAGLFNHAGWFLMEGIRVSSDWFASRAMAFYYVPAPGLFTTLLYYGLLAGLVTGWLFKPGFRRWKIVGAAGLVVLWAFIFVQSATSTKLSILPLNGGMAIFCDRPWSKNDLLVDCGVSNSVYSVMQPFLRAQGVNYLETLLLTHGDLRHVGGAPLLTDSFKVAHVAAAHARSRSNAYRKIVEGFSRRPGVVRTVGQGDSLAKWSVLHPASDDRFSRADDNAVVLYSEINGTRILLLSDLGEAGQEALLTRMPDLRADIVVTGLPAAGEAVGDSLLEHLQPKLLIVADSEYPASERASPALRERLSRRAIPVVYTREAGATTLVLEHRGWRLSTIKNKSS